MDLITSFHQFFPVSYLDLETFEKVMSDFLGEFKKRKMAKRHTELSEKMAGKRYSQIILAEEKEKNMLRETILDFIYTSTGVSLGIVNPDADDGMILLQAHFPYLYLSDEEIPFIKEKTTFQQIFNIDDKEQFFKFCFDQAIFPDLTQDNIENAFGMMTSPDVIDKFVTCIQLYQKKNIICLSNSWKIQSRSKMLVSFLRQNVFNETWPVQIVFAIDNDWYEVKYVNLSSKAVKTYSELDHPSINRLKLLVDLEKEMEDHDKISIIYEPTDNGKDLPLIEVTIGDKKIQLYVGSTYNLYYKDKEGPNNKLVGKIDVISMNKQEKKGKCNIMWIEGYPDSF